MWAMSRFKRRRKRNSIGCGPQTSKLLTDKISDQTFNCYVNIVFSIYIEWLSKEVKRIKINLFVSSSGQEYYLSKGTDLLN